MKYSKKFVAVLSAVAALTLFVSPATHAQSTTAGSRLSQQITAGSITTSFRNSSNGVVASPSFGMSAIAVSANAQTTTGTFGTSDQRIQVDNTLGQGGGWTLSLAGTNGSSTVWTDGQAIPKTYPFNGTAATGQLTVNPGVATITAVSPNNTTGVTKGSQAAFSSSTPITLMTANNTAQKVWSGYMTGVGLSQTVPAYQAPADYTLDLTQTVTAN